MKKYCFDSLLTEDGWLDNAIVAVDDQGIINSIKGGSYESDSEKVAGYALPGFYNAHSHGFQYAMAGLAELHDPQALDSDFWSWREAMYQLALSVNPDQMEAIATMLYAEMARHGYTQVAEFHYVHHDKNGQPYSNLSEMGERMVAAAKTAGIKITLVPIFYQKGGFGKPPGEGQRRFISKSVEDYFNLYDASKLSTQKYKDANVALGIHSMRGVEPTDILKVIEQGEQDVAFHIHISEQLKEIEDSIEYLGKRPVEWLCDNATLNSRFQLVHATHLTDQETQQIAISGAQVIICPSTEGNLGDGIFPLRRFHELGGKWGIGTDSHIGLNPMEELRILDYGQRLISHKRNTFTSSKNGDSASFGFEMVLHAGRIAGNNHNEKYFKEGEPLDCLVIDNKVPLLATCSVKNRLNTILYASDSSWNLGTMTNSRWITNNGHHVSGETIAENFRKAMEELKSR